MEAFNLELVIYNDLLAEFQVNSIRSVVTYFMNEIL